MVWWCVLQSASYNRILCPMHLEIKNSHLQRRNSKNELRMQHYCTINICIHWIWSSTAWCLHSMRCCSGLCFFCTQIGLMFEDGNHCYNVGAHADCFDAALGYKRPPRHARTQHHTTPHHTHTTPHTHHTPHTTHHTPHTTHHTDTQTHRHTQQTTTDHNRPQQTTTDHNRPQQTTTDHNRPQQTTTDHARPRQTTPDHTRPHQTTPDHQTPVDILLKVQTRRTDQVG